MVRSLKYREASISMIPWPFGFGSAQILEVNLARTGTDADADDDDGVCVASVGFSLSKMLLPVDR